MNYLSIFLDYYKIINHKYADNVPHQTVEKSNVILIWFKFNQ